MFGAEPYAQGNSGHRAGREHKKPEGDHEPKKDKKEPFPKRDPNNEPPWQK